MRLILTAGSDEPDWIPRLHTRRGEEPYAILSHRWHEDPNCEVLFADIEDIDESITGLVKNSQYVGSDPRTKAAFPKLQGAAQDALMHGYDYLWVDTCCIDKNSSAELTEAINSMFKWYSTSGICSVYLADCEAWDITTKHGETQFKGSQWWTRGWTLQELLAPPELIFFTSAWAEIGRKDDLDLAEIISEISGIDVNVINGTIPLDSISVAQRMSWAAKRVTSRIEDIAYSLIGIFSVNMPLLYGEGEKAFLRLQQEIMKESDDETIFAWKETQSRLTYDRTSAPMLNGLLATSPASFSSSHNIVQQHAIESIEPFSMTNSGLSISLPLESVSKGLCVAWFHCVEANTNDRIGIYLKKLSPQNAQYARVRTFEWAHKQPQAKLDIVPLYVRQHHDQTPAYKELDHKQRKIRLIQVLPTEEVSGLKLRLLSANIATAKFTALSYIWDWTQEPCEILLNSEQVKIPKRIFTFFQKRQHLSMDVLYWIDAVCIRQENYPERAHQVALMAEIYRHASQVLVLLDNISLDPKDTFALYSPTTPILSLDKSNQAVFAKFAKHPCWLRAWMLQEFLLARDIVLLLDTCTVGLVPFAKAYFKMVADREARSIRPDPDLEPIDPFLRFARSTANLKSPYHKALTTQAVDNGHFAIRFEELLECFPFLQATDPRDRVYAFFNICDLGPDFVVDYSESTDDLFQRVVAARGNRLTDKALSLLREALNMDIREAEPPQLPTGQKDSDGTLGNKTLWKRYFSKS